MKTGQKRCAVAIAMDYTQANVVVCEILNGVCKELNKAKKAGGFGAPHQCPKYDQVSGYLSVEAVTTFEV